VLVGVNPSSGATLVSLLESRAIPVDLGPGSALESEVRSCWEPESGDAAGDESIVESREVCW
jgi:hypothetical protein